MYVAFRTILAWIWEAMRYSEEKAELGAKKSRLTFCLCHQSPFPSFCLWEVTQPLKSLTTLIVFGCLKGREEWKRMWAVLIISMVYIWLSQLMWWHLEHLTFLRVYRKGNTSLIKCCEHGINDTSEELGSFTSGATSGMRLPLGMEMASLVHLPVSTIWFGDRSPRYCMKHCPSGNWYCHVEP